MSLAGMLLVAPPTLTDPNFIESVVVVLLHNESGAFGLVLNRTTDVLPAEAVPAWADVAGPTVRHGSPVETDALIALGRAAGTSEPSGFRTIDTPTLGAIGLVDLHGSPTDDLRDITLFAGYTGWGPRQLDGEILMGGWVVVAAQAGDPFDLGLDTLWGRVLRRADRNDQTLRLLPDDLALN
jgi:putative transcriptional regulator